MMSQEVKNFILENVVSRFLRYVQIWTTSDVNSKTFPSTKNQYELAKILVKELEELNLENILLDDKCYVYADLPASEGLENVKPIGLIAHIDTSEMVSGKNVKPIIHKNYDGKPIQFSHKQDLLLTIVDSPELEKYIGFDIITASGDTLLGADDKAGIAEILTACAVWKNYPQFKHGPITLCFTPDEEIGKGTEHIDKSRLPEVCYTLDGSDMGELEIECFDARKATITFKGVSVHPGYAKNLLVNAIQKAGRFISELPEYQTPEHTEEREGFFHLSQLHGNVEEAIASIIIRDFNSEENERRKALLNHLKEFYELKYPGLKIEIDYLYQYKNMLTFLQEQPKVIDLAKKAMEMANVEVNIHLIRGGTDGARLSEMGIPTPNLFTGGMLFHSRKEYIPTISMQKACEVIIHLAELWSKE
ncbi:MAG: peptidase T [Promethearchaeota archaeon]|nr:MAG: peptidase T [Candidatus Lokiarchaeota archaeon]